MGASCTPSCPSIFSCSKSPSFQMTDSNLLYCEQLLLKLSGIPLKQFKRLNIQIDVDEIDAKPLYVRTIICGNEKKPKLVMLCGFGTSGALMYKILKGLTEDFCVILHDLIGTGGSSLPSRDIQPHDSVEYFVNSIEKWRVALGYHLRTNQLRMTDFYLFGHSFAGYIAANYALKHERHIKKLLLSSPFGIYP